MTDRAADVVVVGAGHNGLVAAAYLAKAGLDVVVCERREVVGGAAVTEELVPGFRVSTASYSLSMLRPDIHADLELARRGLKILPKDPQTFVPLPDGRHFLVWRDGSRTRAELARIHPPDADGYGRWCAFWDETTPVLRPLLEDPDPPRLREVERLVGRDLYDACIAGSAADLVGRFFEAPEVAGVFASQGIIGTRAGVRDPGTAWVLTYHALGGELNSMDGSWAYVEGGMGSVTRAIAEAATDHGAEIRVDATVAEILHDGGRTAGVRLVDGSVIGATTIVSNADPATTHRLAGTTDPRLDTWPTPGSAIKVNLALDDLPDFSAVPGPGPHHHGTISIAPSVDYLQDAFEAASGTQPSPHPFMEIFIQSAVDPTLAPPGKHVLSAFAQYAPDDIGRWDPGIAGDAVIDTIASYAPGLRDLILAEQVLGPLELEERFALPGGNIFHGELLPQYCFGERFAYRTPVGGLYLCGSGTPPGGCVMGAAGRNAARTVLADLA